MSQLEKLFRILQILVSEKFYGSIVIKFENGNIVICKKEENIKL